MRNFDKRKSAETQVESIKKPAVCDLFTAGVVEVIHNIDYLKYYSGIMRLLVDKHMNIFIGRGNNVVKFLC